MSVTDVVQAMNCRACNRRIYPDRCSVPHWSKHKGRGLCARCYDLKRDSGEHIDYERLTRTNAETVEAWRVLSARGCTRAEVAQLMNTTVAALEQAVTRHNRAARTLASAEVLAGSHTGL